MPAGMHWLSVQNLEKRFFPEKIFQLILSLYATDRILSLVLAQLGRFWSENLETWFFTKKLFRSTFTILCCFNFMKKIKNVPSVDFSKQDFWIFSKQDFWFFFFQKQNFGPVWGPYPPKTPEQYLRC